MVCTYLVPFDLLACECNPDLQTGIRYTVGCDHLHRTCSLPSEGREEAHSAKCAYLMRTTFCNSLIISDNSHLAKVDVVSSNLIARSIYQKTAIINNFGNCRFRFEAK